MSRALFPTIFQEMAVNKSRKVCAYSGSGSECSAALKQSEDDEKTQPDLNSALPKGKPEQYKLQIPSGGLLLSTKCSKSVPRFPKIINSFG